MSIVLAIYRTIINFVFMGTITWMMYVPNKDRCWKCSYYEDRLQYKHITSEIFYIFIYCCTAVVITPILSFYLVKNIFVGQKSKSRNIEVMIKSQDWGGIIEMQAYKGNYGIYNKETNENLLMLAVRHNYGRIVGHILSRNDVDLLSTSKDDKTILDYIKLSNPNIDNKSNKKYMSQLLMKIFDKYPNMKTQDQKGDVACLAAYIGDLDTFKTVQSSYISENKHNIDTIYWNYAVDGDQHKMVEYFIKSNQIKTPGYVDDTKTFAEQMIVESKRNILSDLLSQSDISTYEADLWLSSVNSGNLDVIKTMTKYVSNVNAQYAPQNSTVLHIVALKDDENVDENVDEIFYYLRTIVDTKIIDSNRFTADQIWNGQRKKVQRKQAIMIKNPMILLIGIENYSMNNDSDSDISNKVDNLQIDNDMQKLYSYYHQYLNYMNVFPDNNETNNPNQNHGQRTWTRDKLFSFLDEKAAFLETNLEQQERAQMDNGTSNCCCFSNNDNDNDISYFDGLIVVISSRGDVSEKFICTSDHQMVMRENIHRRFSAQNPLSRKIPRVFIFDNHKLFEDDVNTKGIRRRKKKTAFEIGNNEHLEIKTERKERDYIQPQWKAEDENPDTLLALITSDYPKQSFISAYVQMAMLKRDYFLGEIVKEIKFAQKYEEGTYVFNDKTYNVLLIKDDQKSQKPQINLVEMDIVSTI
eukprot:279912_1